MYLAINLKHALSSGLIGALVGIGTTGFFFFVKFLIWKDRVPNWISKIRWILGFILGVITCYIYFELGGDRNSGTLVIAAVVLGIGFVFKNAPPMENEEKRTLSNEGIKISDNLKDIDFDSLNIGTTGSISDQITFQVLNSESKASIWGEKRIEFNIKFSDEKNGSLYYSMGDKSFFIKNGNIRVYYKNMQAALTGLHYLISNNKILNLDRHYVV